MKYFLRQTDYDLTPEDTFLDNDDAQALYVEYPENHSLLWLLFAFLIIIFSGLWMKTFHLQIFASQQEGGQFLTQTSRQRYIKPYRGHIYDSFGNVLAYNTASFDLVFDRSLFPDNQDQQERIITETTAFFGLEEEVWPEALQSEEPEITLKSEVSQEQAILFEVEKDDFPGVSIREIRVRDYNQSEYLSHILGYVGRVSVDDLEEDDRYLRDDQIGKTGVEKFYEKLLRGEYGMIERSGSLETIIRQPEEGSHLQLTVDLELQKVLQDSMKEVLDSAELTRATGIVMNPQTGDILAMSSLPTYDNREFLGGISQEQYQSLLDNPQNPLLHRAIAGEFAPASTVKPFIAGAFLEEGIVDTRTEINDPKGRIVIQSPWDPAQEFIYPDWKIHGRSDVYKSISDSVNVFYYTFGGGFNGRPGLGIERMAQYYRTFGFGERTGIDLPGERRGVVADPEWKQAQGAGNWFLGDTFNVSIGQGGMLATPLQVLNATSAIANGGTLYQPRLYKGVYDNSTKELTETREPEIIRSDILSPESVSIVRDGMRQTVTDGTGYQLQNLPFTSAAKTGTAQTGAELNNSWFTSFAPFENPEIAMVVLVEEGHQGYLTTIPITQKVYQWYYENRGFSNQ